MMALKPVPAVLTKREMSVDINAEPLSSTEEEEEELELEELEEERVEPSPKSKIYSAGFKGIDEKITRTQRGLKEESEKALKPRRGKTDGAGHSRKKKKMVDDPIELIIADEEEPVKAAGEMSDDDSRMIDWMEPTTKRRKPSSSKTYQNARTHNIHAPNKPWEAGYRSVPAVPSPSQYDRDSSSKFQHPDEISSPSLDISGSKKFIHPADNNLSTRRKTRSKLKNEDPPFQVPDEVLSPRSVTANSTKFKLFLDSTTSSATTDPTLTIFSHPGSPPLSRSHSASSLSSVNSIASLLLTQDEKDELMKDDNATKSPCYTLTAQCPLCSTPIPSLLLEEFTIRHLPQNKAPSRLPSRLQQKFCREHRAHTARESWRARGYPDIDWDRLGTTRLTRHLPVLRSILHSKTASFYRDRLADAVRAGKGRRNLLTYLQEGVLDVVKYGYYGPRGAKVAAEAITLRLARELEEVAVVDVVVRDAGVAGFVQAVLVPEVVGRWVAEDRGLRLEGEEWKEEVRRVLEEGEEIGGLVNEDEDRLVVKETTRRGSAEGAHQWR